MFLAASKPFKPGQSGNPAGRKKGGVNFMSALRRVLNEDIKGLTDAGEKRKRADALAESVIAAAIAEPEKFQPLIRELIERDEGKVAQQVNLGTDRSLVDFVAQIEGLDGSQDEAQGEARRN